MTLLINKLTAFKEHTFFTGFEKILKKQKTSNLYGLGVFVYN